MCGHEVWNLCVHNTENCIRSFFSSQLPIVTITSHNLLFLYLCQHIHRLTVILMNYWLKIINGIFFYSVPFYHANTFSYYDFFSYQYYYSWVEAIPHLDCLFFLGGVTKQRLKDFMWPFVDFQRRWLSLLNNLILQIGILSGLLPYRWK